MFVLLRLQFSLSLISSADMFVLLEREGLASGVHFSSVIN
jgi:hypothetical protein